MRSSDSLSSPLAPAAPLRADGRVGAAVASWTKPTLGVKGAGLLLALIGYVAIVGLTFSHEREALSRIAEQFRRVQAQEETITKLSALLARRVADAELDPRAASPASFLVEIHHHMTALQSMAPMLGDVYPVLLSDLKILTSDLQREQEAPFSRAQLEQARSRTYQVVLRLVEAGQLMREQQARSSEEYRRVSDRMRLTVIAATVFGVAVFGVVIFVFLHRLASDVRKAEERALAVVLGYRGPPLEVTRRDEVGRMMAAVNRMQLELRRREKQLELSRQQRFHHEKMAAVGSIAAAVAHEINNPIEAISGMAQWMMQAQRASHCPGVCQPHLIFDQAQRIASITRNIARLAAPGSPQPQLVDVNTLVRSTCDFIAYDKRFSGVELTLDLAHDLRAVKAVPDHLTQILMNLLINAADALAGVQGRKPSIRLMTRVSHHEVRVSVEDNGCGMAENVLSQVFQEYFSTKPAESGGGLGLFLCKEMIEASGGRIDIESSPGAGTKVTIRLPLPVHRIA